MTNESRAVPVETLRALLAKCDDRLPLGLLNRAAWQEAVALVSAKGLIASAVSREWGDLIVAAVNALPGLLDEVAQMAALRAELTQVRARLDEASAWQRRALACSVAIVAIDNADSALMDAGIADALDKANVPGLWDAYNTYDHCLQDAVTLADYVRSPLAESADTAAQPTPSNESPRAGVAREDA